MRALNLASLGLLLAATSLVGCPAPETDTTPDKKTPGWSVVLDESTLQGVVLSVWAASPDEVFIAGGPLGNTGYSALAMHYDGSTWKDLSPGGPETFWWVSGSSPADVWFVGEKGRISHYDGTAMKTVASGVTATLWGAFAFGPDDAWAVGGTPETGAAAPNDIVLHWDGNDWKTETLPGPARNVSLFKVWGTSSDDLFVVGEQGTIWHRTKAGWQFEGGDPLLTQNRLFTVHGCAGDDVFAVGGQSVLHRDASGWSKVTVELTNVVNGVACGPAGKAVIVGFGGLKQRLVDGAWIDEFAIEPYSDLHGSWADGTGVFWAVGGDFLTPPKDGLRKGVVARYIPEP
jgi:hypothetical protein